MTNRKATVNKPHSIRTTITPGEVILVTDAELLDLERQGLVLESPADESTPTPPEKSTSKKASTD